MTNEQIFNAFKEKGIEVNVYETPSHTFGRVIIDTTEHDKRIMIEALEEYSARIMSFINTSNRGNSDYFIIDQIENYIAEQLKEWNNV